MIVPFYHQKNIVLKVPENSVEEINISYVAQNVNIVLIVQPGAHVVCYDIREGNAFASRSIIIHLKENAHLEYIDRQAWHDSVHEYSFMSVLSEAGSNFSYQGLYTGAKYAYTNITLELRAQNSNAQLHIGSIAREKNQHKIITKQYHMVPGTQSSCVVRSAVYDRACSEYEGTVRIDEFAHGCRASQKHKSLLLSADARASACPSLEIHAHDVQCGHGSAIGQIDDEQLFYMQSRGIAKEQAKKMLVRSFFDALYTDDLLRAAMHDAVL